MQSIMEILRKTIQIVSIIVNAFPKWIFLFKKEFFSHNKKEEFILFVSKQKKNFKRYSFSFSNVCMFEKLIS